MGQDCGSPGGSRAVPGSQAPTKPVVMSKGLVLRPVPSMDLILILPKGDIPLHPQRGAQCPSMPGAVSCCLLTAFVPGWGSGTALTYHPPQGVPNDSGPWRFISHHSTLTGAAVSCTVCKLALHLRNQTLNKMGCPQRLYIESSQCK